MSEQGYITARAYMSNAQIPLENVAVTILSQDGTAIAMRLTGRSGLLILPPEMSRFFLG